VRQLVSASCFCIINRTSKRRIAVVSTGTSRHRDATSARQSSNTSIFKTSVGTVCPSTRRRPGRGDRVAPPLRSSPAIYSYVQATPAAKPRCISIRSGAVRPDASFVADCSRMTPDGRDGDSVDDRGSHAMPRCRL